MKRVASSFLIFLGIFFISSNLLAASKPMGSLDVAEQNASARSKRPCALRGYSKLSCPTGQKPSGFCPEDSKYFSSCGCDLKVYKYSNKNCDLKMMELSGESCLSETSQVYTSCKCRSDFKICRKGAVPHADSCTDEDGKKYDACKEDIASCESMGQLSRQPKGYKCHRMKIEYRFCYISSTCEKIEIQP